MELLGGGLSWLRLGLYGLRLRKLVEMSSGDMWISHDWLRLRLRGSKG
jgi:hypothetical protein